MSAPAHVLVLRPIIERLRAQGHEVEVTSREYAQTQELLELHGIEHTPIGRHGGASRLRKLAGSAQRTAGMRRFGRGRALRPRARPRLQRPRDRRAGARHPRGEHARLRVRGHPAPDRLPAREAGDLPRLGARRSGCGASASGPRSCSSTRGSRRSTTSPTSSPTPSALERLGVDTRARRGRRPPAARRLALSPQVEPALPPGPRRGSAATPGSTRSSCRAPRSSGASSRAWSCPR